MKTFNLHTIDAVNRSYVEELSARHGYTVVTVEPRDGTPESFDSPALVDLDFTASTPAERFAFVQKYSQMPRTHPLAVFSYNLEDEDVRKLEANGIKVFPRMNDDAMAEFVRAMTPDAPPEPNRERSIEELFGLHTRV